MLMYVLVKEASAIAEYKLIRAQTLQEVEDTLIIVGD